MFFKTIIQKIKENLNSYLLGILILIFLISFLSNSSNSSSSFSSKSTYQSPISEGEISMAYDSGSFRSEQMISKNFNLRLSLENFDFESENVVSKVKNFGGIILSDNLNERSNRKYRSLNVKILSEKSEDLIAELRTIGEVESFRISAYDETENFESVDTKYQRYLSQIEKYKLMLERDDMSVKEEIDLNLQIDKLEDKISSYLQSKKRIENKVIYSSIFISLEEKTFLQNVNIDLKNLLEEFLENLYSSFTFMLSLIAYAIPFLIVWFMYKFFKRIKRPF